MESLCGPSASLDKASRTRYRRDARAGRQRRIEMIVASHRVSPRNGSSAALVCVVALAAGGGSFDARTARAADSDPDRQAVEVVCGKCHTTEVFRNQSRSWDRWNDVFADMTQRGAKGTDEQLARVTTYFLENLTLVNINSSPPDELAGVLSVSDEVAESIVQRRQRQPFTNIDQLRTVPGVDPRIVEQRKSRIQF
jgi:hypothetical protein